MAASKTRVDWSLLLLRLAVGGLSVLQGFEALRHAHGGASFAQAAHLGLALAELLCGALVVIGLWTWLMAALLVGITGWPLVHAWLHGAGILANPGGLFRLLATLACAVGGAGKWGADR